MSESESRTDSGTIVRFPREAMVRPIPPGQDRQAAIARLRDKIKRDTVIYAVRRAHDAASGWIVCDFYLINGAAAERISEDVARVLECYDPKREVGVKLRRSQGVDPLVPIIAGRLSTVLFGRPGALGHCLIG
jgi:hypothetical protein